ncbi:hypothetical protein EBU91_04445 [bacterium]|nr:hypothetical protein [bacterium]
MFYYIRKLNSNNIIIDEFIFDECTIHQLYHFAYEMIQDCDYYIKVEIWQNYFNQDRKLCTIIKPAIPPTNSKKKYDQRTGIFIYSEI